MVTFLAFISIIIITINNVQRCETAVYEINGYRHFSLSRTSDFKYLEKDVEVMDEFKKYFYFKMSTRNVGHDQDKVLFFPQESPYYLTIEFKEKYFMKENRVLPGFRFDFDASDCPTNFNNNLTKSGYISVKRGDTACLYDFWIKQFNNYVNISINGYEETMLDVEEFKNITFFFLRNGTYKAEHYFYLDGWPKRVWIDDGIDINNLTLLDERRNCKLIQPRKNNETKIAFIVHSNFHSCDLRLIMDNGKSEFFAKLPLKYSPVEQKAARREWDTSEAELPPPPDADGPKYKYDDGFDVFILLIIWTVILATVLIYEILYRVFNKGRGIYPLSFALTPSADKKGSAEGGSNSGTVLPSSSAQSSAEQQHQQLPPQDITECPSTEDPRLETKFVVEPNWKRIGIEYGEIRENDTKICLPLPGRIHDERLKLLRAHYATQVVPGILETGHIDGGIYYRDGENPKFIYDGDEYETKEEAQLAVHYDRQFLIKEWYEQTHKNDMAYFWANQTAMKWDPFTFDLQWEKEEQNYYEFKADLEFMKNVREGKYNHLGMNDFIKERLQN